MPSTTFAGRGLMFSSLPRTLVPPQSTMAATNGSVGARWREADNRVGAQHAGRRHVHVGELAFPSSGAHALRRSK